MTADSLRMPLRKTVILNRIRYRKSQQTVTKMHCTHSIPSYGRRFIQYSQKQNKKIIMSVNVHMPPSEQEESIHHRSL